ARQFQFVISEQKADELKTMRGLTLNASSQFVAPRVAPFEQRLEISLDHGVRRGSRFPHARGELFAGDYQLGFWVAAEPRLFADHRTIIEFVRPLIARPLLFERFG